MKTSLVMLDSGAFSVWNKGKEIDLEEYVQFCRQHPYTSYFVNLDVIPGEPNNKRSLTPENVEASCKQSWKNYQRMLKVLPFEKVIPVFHQDDSFKWLERYLDFGTPYLGISPANDRVTSEKLKWMSEVAKYILDSNGEPVVKTHGFAVTSYDLMNFWHWHSVDSASWILVAGYGGIWVPRMKRGKWDFTREPVLVACSPNSPKVSTRGAHFNSMSLLERESVMKYLEELGVTLGQFEILRVSKNHKLADDELWYGSRQDRNGKRSTKQAKGFGLTTQPDRKRSIIKVLEKGVVTSMQKRAYVNVRFMQTANKYLSVDHIYFAGGSGAKIHIEKHLGRRLFTYALLKSSSGFLKRYKMHLKALKEQE